MSKCTFYNKLVCVEKWHCGTACHTAFLGCIRGTVVFQLYTRTINIYANRGRLPVIAVLGPLYKPTDLYHFRDDYNFSKTPSQMSGQHSG